MYPAEELEDDPEVIWTIVNTLYGLEDDECCCDESQKLRKENTTPKRPRSEDARGSRTHIG